MENLFQKLYQELPRPKSFMPGPVAPWASINPEERKINIDEFILALRKQKFVRENLAELNEVSIEPSSAVLAPFILDAQNNLDFLVVTQRPESMKTYSGHIAFPGGHLEEDDIDLQHCALRETQEEIGVDPDDIKIIGRTNDTQTKTADVLIAPFVGVVSSESISKATLSPDEVQYLHLIKVEDLLKPDNYYCEMWDGPTSSYLIHIFTVFNTENRPVFIWGATANIIFELLKMPF